MAGPEWKDDHQLRDHFPRHRRTLQARTLADYAASSAETVEVGTRFNYRDPDTGNWRIGYYDRLTRRFTVVTDDDTEIVSRFRCAERYVEDLPGSDYA